MFQGFGLRCFKVSEFGRFSFSGCRFLRAYIELRAQDALRLRVADSGSGLRLKDVSLGGLGRGCELSDLGLRVREFGGGFMRFKKQRLQARLRGAESLLTLLHPCNHTQSLLVEEEYILVHGSPIQKNRMRR